MFRAAFLYEIRNAHVSVSNDRAIELNFNFFRHAIVEIKKMSREDYFLASYKKFCLC